MLCIHGVASPPPPSSSHFFSLHLFTFSTILRQCSIWGLCRWRHRTKCVLNSDGQLQRFPKRAGPSQKQCSAPWGWVIVSFLQLMRRVYPNNSSPSVNIQVLQLIPIWYGVTYTDTIDRASPSRASSADVTVKRKVTLACEFWLHVKISRNFICGDGKNKIPLLTYF